MATEMPGARAESSRSSLGHHPWARRGSPRGLGGLPASLCLLLRPPRACNSLGPPPARFIGNTGRSAHNRRDPDDTRVLTGTLCSPSQASVAGEAPGTPGVPWGLWNVSTRHLPPSRGQPAPRSCTWTWEWRALVTRAPAGTHLCGDIPSRALATSRGSGRPRNWPSAGFEPTDLPAPKHPSSC